MAQERSISPEKQLLKLIEEGTTNSFGLKTQSIKHQSGSLFSLNAWFGRFMFAKDWFRAALGNLKFQDFDAKFLNKILIMLVILLSSYSMNFFVRSFLNLNKVPSLELAAGEVQKQEEALQKETSAKPFSYYLEKVAVRNIFKIGAAKPSAKTPNIIGPSQRMIDNVAHLRLVGISWSDDPDAMIEDTKAMRTFFVKRGQMIGDIQVSAIFKDKVILSDGREEIDLK